MAITERQALSITILEDGQIQLQRARIIEENGELIAERYHRSVLVPGEDISTLPKRVRDICNVIWTPQVIADFQAARLARAARGVL